MAKSKINYKLINFTTLMVLIFICTLSINLWWGIVTKIVTVLLPFIIAFAFAYVFNPLVNFMEKKGIRRGIAVFIIIITLLVLLGLLFAISLPIFYEQAVSLIKMTINAFNTIDTKYDINLGPMKIQITDYLNDILKEFGTGASNFTFDIIGKSFGFFGKLIVGFVGFIYFLADMEKIKKSFSKILLKIGKKWYNYFKLLDSEISNYLKGLEIFMIIQFFEYTLIFFFIGHPNWQILGILACITTVIPYFGGLITNFIGIITACAVSGKLFILTVIVTILFPSIDGYFISPRIYGKTNKVNPLITIMVVSVGGTILGPIGIVVALPCYLLVRTTYNYFSKDLKKGMDIVKKTI